ncbi:MAG: O-antigen ligase family protein [Bacteroidetes bacterium]|nr:O-antigen ligase family protein [Bacteroidota bacterium]
MRYGIEKIKKFINVSRIYILYAFLTSIIFSLLVPNSICIIALFAGWLFEGDLKEKWNRLKKDFLFIAYAIYFFVQARGIFTATDFYTGWCAVEGKLGLLIIPVIFCSSTFVNQEMRKKLMMALGILLTLATLYCLSVNTVEYMHTRNTELFFYHRLVSAIDQHAIYFSVYIFIFIVFLLREKNIPLWLQQRAVIRISWILFFIGIIILLSSKMVLVFLIAYSVYIIIYHSSPKYKKWRPVFLGTVIVIFSSILFLFNNPVKRRFDDLLQNNVSLMQKQQYSRADYFNGIEFRLLLWRFTYEILRDNHAFVAGVGPANTQSMLQQKYLSMNLYAGDKNRGDQGYMNYNCHNQFLQVSLQSGVIGLLAFLFWCYMIIVKTIRKKNVVLSGIVLITFIFFFTESVLERQYGMILCSFFPLLFLYPEKEEKNS